MELLYFSGNKQIAALVVWAREIPHFSQLEMEDQVLLIKSSWNELLLFAIAWRSIEYLEDERENMDGTRTASPPQLMCLMPGNKSSKISIVWGTYLCMVVQE